MNDLNVYGEKDSQKETSLSNVMATMVSSRQAQEVQAAMVVAKRFPRDEQQSMSRILTACNRPSLAESALYSYPKGGTEVTGPSIRLAECIAQNWGNMDFGYIELEQGLTESQVMAYAWDLETNTRQSKIFCVPHLRVTQNGSYPLKDPRDIYELVANQASRRVRSCILAIIPGDVVESAVKQCELTLKAGSKVPLEERIKDMVARFSEIDVTEDQLTKYIGKKISAFSESDIIKLGKVYRSIKDGIVGSDYFISKFNSDTQNKKEDKEKTVPEEAQTAPAYERQVSLNDL